MTSLQSHIEAALKIVHEYFRPEDFKCGGCLECEACHHYFVDIDELLSTHLTLLGESVKDLVPKQQVPHFNTRPYEANQIDGFNDCRAQTINNIERFLK